MRKHLATLGFLLALGVAALAQSIPFPGPGLGVISNNPGTPQTLGTGTSNSGGANPSCTTSTTQTMSYANNVSTGDMLVVAAGQLNGSNVITGVSDGTNSYVHAVTSATVAGITTEIWYKVNAASVGAGATLTVTWTSAATFCNVNAARVTGVTSVDLTPTATNGISTAPSISSGILGTAKEAVFGIVYTNGGAVNITNSPFTQLSCAGVCSNSGGASMSMEYDITASTASVTDAPTLGTSRQWVSAMITLH